MGSSRPCPTTTLLHSENPTTRRGHDVDHGWVAQLAEQWTENLTFCPRRGFRRRTACEPIGPLTTKNDRHHVNITSTVSYSNRDAHLLPMQNGLKISKMCLFAYIFQRFWFIPAPYHRLGHPPH